jgi:hypothetical protein
MQRSSSDWLLGALAGGDDERETVAVSVEMGSDMEATVPLKISVSS